VKIDILGMHNRCLGGPLEKGECISNVKGA